MIHVLTGVNSFLIKERKNKLVSEFTDEFGNIGIEQIEADEVPVERITESLESVSFLSPKKLLILKNLGANKAFTENVKDILGRVSDTTDVVIIESKFDKRSAYYKFAKKLEGFEEFNQLEGNQLISWMAEYVKKWKAEINNEAARELIARVGSDQQKLANELDKLSMYSDKIDIDAVRELSVRTPSSTIFELIESAFSGDKKKAIRLYEEQRELQVEPMQIIAMLSWQFHILALIKAAGNLSPQDIAFQAKLNPYVVQKSTRLTRKISIDRLKSLVHDLRLIDEKSKSVRIDLDDAIKAFMISI